MRISDWSSDVCSSDLETHELKTQPAFELEELTQIYEARGLGRALAEQVAAQLMAHDALDSHLRDELGLTRDTRARPVQARSEEHTSELQSLMRISHAVFCLQKKNQQKTQQKVNDPHMHHRKHNTNRYRVCK